VACVCPMFLRLESDDCLSRTLVQTVWQVIVSLLASLKCRVSRVATATGFAGEMKFIFVMLSSSSRVDGTRPRRSKSLSTRYVLVHSMVSKGRDGLQLIGSHRQETESRL